MINEVQRLAQREARHPLGVLAACAVEDLA